MKKPAEVQFRRLALKLSDLPEPRAYLPSTAVPVIGLILDINPDGLPIVEVRFSNERNVFPARSTVPITADQLGREALLLFEQNDFSKPIIVGLLQRTSSLEQVGNETNLESERLVLSAQQEITLSCGKASIVLTRAGKILLKGAYLLSRSSGVNRIKGGSVQIN